MGNGVLPFNPSAFVAADTSPLINRGQDMMLTALSGIGNAVSGEVQKAEHEAKIRAALADPAVKAAVQALLGPAQQSTPGGAPDPSASLGLASGAAQNFMSSLPGQGATPGASTGAPPAGSPPPGASSAGPHVEVTPGPPQFLSPGASPPPDTFGPPTPRPAAPALSPMPAQGQAQAGFPMPSSPEAFGILQQLAPAIGQRRSAQDAASSREEVARLRSAISAHNSVMRTGASLAAVAASVLKAQIAAEAKLRSIAAKPSGPNDIKTLKDAAHEAQQLYESLNTAVGAAQASGTDVATDDSDAGRQRLTHITQLIKQRDEALNQYQTRNELYQQALSNMSTARGLVSTGTVPTAAPKRDITSLSKEELLKLAR